MLLDTTIEYFFLAFCGILEGDLVVAIWLSAMKSFLSMPLIFMVFQPNSQLRLEITLVATENKGLFLLALWEELH